LTSRSCPHRRQRDCPRLAHDSGAFAYLVGNPASLIFPASLNLLICLEPSRGTGLALLRSGDSSPNRAPTPNGGGETPMEAKPEDTEAVIDRLVERSVQHAVFGDRRDFLKVVGAGAAAAALADVFPLQAAKALAQAKPGTDRKSTRLNSSHVSISYAVFCLKKKTASLIMHT